MNKEETGKLFDNLNVYYDAYNNLDELRKKLDSLTRLISDKEIGLNNLKDVIVETLNLGQDNEYVEHFKINDFNIMKIYSYISRGKNRRTIITILPLKVNPYEGEE